MTVSELVIQTNNLTKVYKTGRKQKLALENLNLSVYRGEIFGYLGPNGAGKTTTIRMLLDLIRPTSGSAKVLGMDTQASAVDIHKQIGFLPGELALWNNERAINIIRYFGRVRGKVDMAYVRQLADRLQFDTSMRVRDYSTGNKRKLGLILALMNRPQLLILDEPTSGLDPLMQQVFNELMLEVKREGRTVFLSSHLLSEVQAICDRVAILRTGQLKAVETVEDLTHVDFRWVSIRTRNLQGLVSRLGSVPGVTEVAQKNSHIELRLNGDFDPLMRALNDQYVVDLRVKEPTLEEIFLTFYDNNPAVKRHHAEVEHVEKEQVS
ncbi:MAG: ABC transporter ATP-binding protein [bacterium]|nr:ABC transporter ATP-binding protein [bacterium]